MMKKICETCRKNDKCRYQNDIGDGITECTAYKKSIMKFCIDSWMELVKTIVNLGAHN